MPAPLQGSGKGVGPLYSSNCLNFCGKNFRRGVHKAKKVCADTVAGSCWRCPALTPASGVGHKPCIPPAVCAVCGFRCWYAPVFRRLPRLGLRWLILVSFPGRMRASTLLFTKLVGMWDSPNWNADGTWDGQGSGHDSWGTVRWPAYSNLCVCSISSQSSWTG